MQTMNVTPLDTAASLRTKADLPETCTLDPLLILAVVMMEPDACAGCNEDRTVCQGRPRKEVR